MELQNGANIIYEVGQLQNYKVGQNNYKIGQWLQRRARQIQRQAGITKREGERTTLENFYFKSYVYVR